MGGGAWRISFDRGGGRETDSDIKGTGPLPLVVGPAGVGGPSRSPSSGTGRPAGMAEAPPTKAGKK